MGRILLKRLQFTSDSLNVNLIGNFDVNTTTATGNFQHLGTWYDLVTGDTVNVSATNIQVKLNPGQFKYYIDNRSFISIEPHPNIDQIGIFPNPGRRFYLYKYHYSDNKCFYMMFKVEYCVLKTAMKLLITEY